MKDNQYNKPLTKIYIVQEQPIKQSNLSLAARNKIVNKNQVYQSQNQDSYGPCLTYNPNCECSLEELQRQEQILKNREVEERIRRQNNEESQQGRNEQEINLQNQLTNLQRSFRELQEENRDAVQALGINNLSDLPVLLNGESLANLLNRVTQRQSNWWWSNSSTNTELQRITTERNEARENLQTIQQQLQDEQTIRQNIEQRLEQVQQRFNEAQQEVVNLRTQKEEISEYLNIYRKWPILWFPYEWGDFNNEKTRKFLQQHQTIEHSREKEHIFLGNLYRNGSGTETDLTIFGPKASFYIYCYMHVPNQASITYLQDGHQNLECHTLPVNRGIFTFSPIFTLEEEDKGAASTSQQPNLRKKKITFKLSNVG